MNPDKAKALILQILVKDMKHEQLVAGLGRIGLTTELHALELSGVVLELMGRKEDTMSWEWFDIYMEHLGKAAQYDITETGTNLLPLAESCYVYLLAQLEMEGGRLKD